jgi:hypothetical protein
MGYGPSVTWSYICGKAWPPSFSPSAVGFGSRAAELQLGASVARVGSDLTQKPSIDTPLS